MDLTPTTTEAETIAEIRRVLTEQMSIRGRGTKGKTLKRIGMSLSTFDMAFTRGSIKVVQLLRILAELGIDPGQFLREAVPARSEEPLPKAPPPKIVEIGLQRRVQRKVK